MSFIHENFLLHTESARRLYSQYAAPAPILDFHNHLSPRDIAEDRRFTNLTEIWLEGDHYKWRAMRAMGVPEHYCSGGASPYEKFLAWARTFPRTLRNPLYHWTQLELLRYFGISDLLDETTAPSIWKRANEALAAEGLTARGILRKFRVVAVCTTDDPTESLEYHVRIRESGFQTLVFPAFRPDAAFRTAEPAAFRVWTDRLGSSANIDIVRLRDFLDALRKRHDVFHAHGCRISDHGLNYCYSEPCGEREAAEIFAKVRSGQGLDSDESAKFASYMLLFFGQLDAARGWTKQLHLGAYRNSNARMRETLGPDAGYDSIGDWPQARHLATYMDRLDHENALPKMVVFNVNPADNYVFATLIGNFQQEGVAGKIQFGSGWWFLDQKEGIEWQLNALSNCGLLSSFVGMTSDSRSFLSFPRHEYFRRILCNALGTEIESGLIPNDEALVGSMVRDICFDNAVSYFGLPLNAQDAEKSVLTSQRS